MRSEKRVPTTMRAEEMKESNSRYHLPPQRESDRSWTSVGSSSVDEGDGRREVRLEDRVGEVLEEGLKSWETVGSSCRTN